MNSYAEPLLELKKASKAYNSSVNTLSPDETSVLLDDVSLVVRPGDRIGIFSSRNIESISLINCLAGICSLDKGELIHRASVSWPVGTNDALDPKLTGHANTRFAFEIYEEPANYQEKLELVRNLSEFTEDQFHSPISTYSGREMQAFRLALSLVIDFDCYLIGRVGDGWKRKGQVRKPSPVFAYMKERLEGKTLLITSAKQVIFALRYCTTGIAIIDGKIAYNGDPKVCLDMALEHRQQLTLQQIEANTASDSDDLSGEDLDES